MLLPVVGVQQFRKPTQAAPSPKIWTIGDSITLGQINNASSTVQWWQAGWRKWVYQHLLWMGFSPVMLGGIDDRLIGLADDVAGRWQNGLGGSSSAQWRDTHFATYNAALGATPDVITVALGANGTNVVSNGTAVGQVLDLAIAAYPAAKILCANRTPRWDQSSDVVNGQIATEVATRAAAGKLVTLVDQFAALTTADMPDGLHPDSDGYKKLGVVWSAAVMAAVSA